LPLGFPWDSPGIPLGFPWDSPIQDYFGACRAGVFQQEGFMASEEMVEHLLSAPVDSPTIPVEKTVGPGSAQGDLNFHGKDPKDHVFSMIFQDFSDHSTLKIRNDGSFLSIFMALSWVNGVEANTQLVCGLGEKSS